MPMPAAVPAGSSCREPAGVDEGGASAGVVALAVGIAGSVVGAVTEPIGSLVLGNEGLSPAEARSSAGAPAWKVSLVGLAHMRCMLA